MPKGVGYGTKKKVKKPQVKRKPVKPKRKPQ